ncbi:CPBP family intramembrane metalloprotease [Desulfosarcina sp.]|nr:CPBP family intramembrane metalloprotease [Desulfosarcina sp.]
MRKLNAFEILTTIVLCITGIVLIGLQNKLFGWIIWLIGLASLLLCRKDFAKEFLLIFISMGLLGITRITTDVSYIHMVEMGITLTLAIAIPYYVSRYVYKDNLIKFKFHHGRKWFKSEILYIAVTAVLAYLILPIYLKDTSAYLNWTVNSGWENITKLFIGTNALGIWDELFFISTVLGILRRYIPFHWANIVQAVLFTSFLFELGFTGWGFIMIYLFALIQGYVFRKTDSLFYVITIHLTLDLILFLALIWAHHPSWMPVFVVF